METMIDAIGHAGSLLLQAATTIRDTIVTKPMAAERSWFDQLTAIARGLVSISLLVLTVAVVPAAWNVR